ncbi:MAG: hypothetical protein II401_11040 [Bacteroidales bacterium]|nr:hypothetical protein [Bacteroidales bacterium]
MIIQNGTIEVKNKTAGGIDLNTGHPVKSASTWGEPIACQYTPNTHNNLGRTVNGQHFTQASYVVLVEEQEFAGEQIRLKDKNGREIGEFSVISVETLEAVCELRILI